MLVLDLVRVPNPLVKSELGNLTRYNQNVFFEPNIFLVCSNVCLNWLWTSNLRLDWIRLVASLSVRVVRLSDPTYFQVSRGTKLCQSSLLDVSVFCSLIWWWFLISIIFSKRLNVDFRSKPTWLATHLITASDQMYFPISANYILKKLRWKCFLRSVQLCWFGIEVCAVGRPWSGYKGSHYISQSPK